jgi:glycosyltransferase involved in cell wall biosynthesis
MTNPESKPRTSVIIPCHNYGRFLSWCITSAIHQSRSAKEIIVIDDDSDDETEAVARTFGDQICYLKVHYRNAQKTRNHALGCATGEYVLYIDADDFLDNDALLLMEAQLDKNPDLRLVYSDRFNFGDLRLAEELGFSPHWESRDFSIDKLRRANFISMPSLIRRKDFRGFDERIRLNQDWEAWLSLLQADHHAARIARPLYCHRFHGKNKTVQENELTERLKIMLAHGLVGTVIARQSGEFMDFQFAPWRRSTIHILIHSANRVDLNVLAETLQHWKTARIVAYLFPQLNGAQPEQQLEEILKVRSVPVEPTPAVTVEAFLRGFLSTAYRFANDDDIFVMTDFSKPCALPTDFLNPTDQPQACIDEESGSFINIRSIENTHFVALNGRALRQLLYIFEPPPNRLRRLWHKLESMLHRHLLWRFSSSSH